MNIELLRDLYLSALRRAQTRKDLIQIKHRLLDRQISIQAIANKLNVSRTLISLILKGERKGYRHRPKIARALGLSVEELFGERNGKRRAA